MTEFEEAISELIGEIDGDYAVFMPDYHKYIEKFAPKILEAARKQFIEEACEWLKENIYWRYCLCYRWCYLACTTVWAF